MNSKKLIFLSLFMVAVFSQAELTAAAAHPLSPYHEESLEYLSDDMRTSIDAFAAPLSKDDPRAALAVYTELARLFKVNDRLPLSPIQLRDCVAELGFTTEGLPADGGSLDDGASRSSKATVVSEGRMLRQTKKSERRRLPGDEKLTTTLLEAAEGCPDEDAAAPLPDYYRKPVASKMKPGYSYGGYSSRDGGE